MGRIAFTKRVYAEPVVNLTPLIDVVFVILIMFIVIAPLLEQDRIELADSKEEALKSNTVREESPIKIYVDAENRIKISGKVVSLQEIKKHLKEAKALYPTANVQLFQDRKAHFGIYQSIKNQVELAGFETLDVILKPS